MMSTSYLCENSSGLFSHHGKSLEKHLLDVAKLSESLFRENYPLSLDERYKEQLLKIPYLIGLCHDIGKSTQYFQEHLLNGKFYGAKSHHSLISAIICYYIVKSYLNSVELPEDLKTYFLICSFCIVRQHHGDLRDFLDLLSSDISTGCELLHKQVDSIDEEKFTKLINNINLQSITLQDIHKWIYDFSNNELLLIRQSYRKNIASKNNDNLKYYFLSNLLYSCLLEADKSDVVLGGEIPKKKNILLSEKEFEIYKSNLVPTGLSDLREEYYKKTVEKFYKEIDQNKNNRIYQLVLPTGMGKTLTGLRLANILKEKLYQEKNHVYRMIYILPFINIIEQNARTIKNLLSLKIGKVTHDIMLAHHHFSDLLYSTSEETYESEKANFLIEGWNSEFIITTFVQFFHTLISNKNSMLRKFNKMNRSIIVIDEIQTIPLRYWNLVKNILSQFLEYTDSYAIIMTATNPITFENSTKIDVLPTYNINRYVIDAQTYTENLTPEKFVCKVALDNRKSAFIVNTIAEAEEIYDLLKKKLKYDIGFLSSHVIPKHRLNMIDAIKNNKFKILVSTQIIEAGVDIDFDVVFRDIAPLDSIIQAAGRCNRNANTELGHVYIMFLYDKNKRKFADYIYDPILVDITSEIIKGKILSETDASLLFKEYMYEVEKRKDLDASKNLLTSISMLQYTNIGNFKLINEEYSQIDVFITADEDAEKIFSEYKKIWNMDNYIERKIAFDSIKSEFYQYVISVPKKFDKLIPFECGYYCVPIYKLEDYYDFTKGFALRKGNNSVEV